MSRVHRRNRLAGTLVTDWTTAQRRGQSGESQSRKADTSLCEEPRWKTLQDSPQGSFEYNKVS